MRYKGFEWPVPPKELCVRYARTVKDLALPYWGGVLQDMGIARRVAEGEGVFLGEAAALNFHNAAEIFAQKGAGLLELPGHSPFMAVFSALELVGQERPGAVRYRFTFLEDAPLLSGEKAGREYICAGGESLWAVANTAGCTVTALLQKNSVRRPACLAAGERLVLP